MNTSKKINNNNKTKEVICLMFPGHKEAKVMVESKIKSLCAQSTSVTPSYQSGSPGYFYCSSRTLETTLALES